MPKYEKTKDGKLRVIREVTTVVDPYRLLQAKDQLLEDIKTVEIEAEKVREGILGQIKVIDEALDYAKKFGISFDPPKKEKK